MSGESARGFRLKLLRIANGLQTTDLNSLKFLYEDLPTNLRDSQSPTDFLTHLEDNNLLGINNFTDFAENLKEIGQGRLASLLTGQLEERPQIHCQIAAGPEITQNSRAMSSVQTGEQPQCHGGCDDQSTNKELHVTGHIGSDWSRMARYLGLTATEVDAINYDHTKIKLVDKADAAIAKWKQKRGQHATYDALLSVLKRLPRMDIVHDLDEVVNEDPSVQLSVEESRKKEDGVMTGLTSGVAAMSMNESVTDK